MRRATLLLLALALSACSPRVGPPRPFDSARWKACTGSNRRLEMIDDLERRVLRVGMTQSEIEILLGRASTSTNFDGAVTWSWWVATDDDTGASTCLVVKRDGGALVESWWRNTF